MIKTNKYIEKNSGKNTNKYRKAGTEYTRLDDEVLARVVELVEEQILQDAKDNPDHAKLAFSMYDYLVNMKDWRELQKPFTAGYSWDSLEDTHKQLEQIAKDHGVYDEVKIGSASCRERA